MWKVVSQSSVSISPVDMDGASGVDIQWLVSELDDAPNFFMRRFTVAVEGYTPKHTHSHEHEVYILSGRGKVFIDNDWHNIEENYAVYIPPEIEHQFVNSGDEPLIFLCLVPRK